MEREHIIHKWKKVSWGEGASFFESVESASYAPAFLRRLEVPDVLLYPDEVYFKIVRDFLQPGEEIGVLTKNVVKIRYGKRAGLSFVIPAQLFKEEIYGTEDHMGN